MIGALADIQRAGHPGERLAGLVGDRPSDQCGAQVFVRRDIQQPGLRAVRRRRPVLAAPGSRAEIRQLAGAGLVFLGHDRMAGLRVQAGECVVIDEGLAGDEVDRPRGAFQHPQIPVARHIDQALDGLPVVLVVDDDRRRDLVPVPGIVLVVLVITLHLPGVRVQRDDRGCEEVVARPLVAHPGTAIAGAPEGQFGVRIIHPGDPNGRPTGLPLVAFRPGLTARLARRRHHEGLPQFLARLGVIGGDETAHTEFAARGAQDHLAIDDQRRQRHVIAVRVVLDRGGPDLLAGLGIQRDKRRIHRGEIDFVAPQPDAPAGGMQLQHVVGDRALVAPQQLTGLGVQRHHLVAGSRHEHHAVVDHWRRLMAFQLPGGQGPGQLQVPGIGGRDLRQRAVAPAVIGAAEHQPVAIGRVRQPRCGDRLVVGQDGRHWRGWRDGLAVRRHRVRRGQRRGRRVGCRRRVRCRRLGQSGGSQQPDRQRGGGGKAADMVGLRHVSLLLLFVSRKPVVTSAGSPACRRTGARPPDRRRRGAAAKRQDRAATGRQPAARRPSGRIASYGRGIPESACPRAS